MLDEPGFESPWVDSVLHLTERINTRMVFPQLGTALEFIGGIFPTIMPIAFIRLKFQCQRIIRSCIEANNAARAAEASGMEKEKPKTIFQSILNPTNERNHRDMPLDHLVDQAMTMLIAGTDTTASLIQFATWRFMTDQEVQWKLLAELDSVSCDDKGQLPLSKLEALPYFTGFIKECLRYYTIAAGRMPRVVPKGGLTVPSTGVHIPAGTVINFCINLIHRDPRIFSEPDRFLPERWFGQPGKELEKWLLSFSKGDRICVASNLAYAEAYLVLANLFRKFEMEPWETTAEDMEWRDHAVARPMKKLQVLAKRRVVQV
jgi:cytochrome P450